MQNVLKNVPAFLIFYVLLSAHSSHADEVPDISGVWTLIKRDPPTVVFDRNDPTPSEQGQKILNEYRKRYDLNALGLEPLANCVTAGMPSAMFGVGGSLLEIIQQPDRVIIVSEMNHQIRKIRLNAATHREDYPHTRTGDSIGHWEKNILVTDTTLVESWLLPVWPHTDNVRFAERFYLMDANKIDFGNQRIEFESESPDVVLVDEMTMIDPDLYDEPVKATMYYSRIPEHYFMEYNCPEGIFWEKVEAMLENKN